MAEIFTNVKVKDKVYNSLTEGFLMPSIVASGTLAEDTILRRLDIKDSVRVRSDTNLDANSTISGAITYNSTGGISSRGQITATLVTTDILTISGITFGAADDGSRILLTAQDGGAGTDAENGIWTTTISGTALTLDRATDFDSDDEVRCGAQIYISQGQYEKETFFLTTINPIIIGGSSGTALTFEIIDIGIQGWFADKQMDKSLVAQTWSNTEFGTEADPTTILATVTTSNTTDYRYWVMFSGMVSSSVDEGNCTFTLNVNNLKIDNSECTCYFKEGSNTETQGSRKTEAVALHWITGLLGNGVEILINAKADGAPATTAKLHYYTLVAVAIGT